MIRRLLNWMGYGLNTEPGTQQPTPLSYAAETPEPVSFETAMQLSAVWACARLISETIASLPLTFYEEQDGRAIATTTGDLPQLFRGMVNRYQTKQEFLETYILNLVLHGNAYALKQRVGTRLVGLVPMMSAQVETRLLRDGSVVHLHYQDGKVVAHAADSVWHSKLFGNGIIGLSPLAYARNTVGIGLASEKRTAAIFKNGGKPTGVLMYDKVLTEEQRTALRREFAELREGNGDSLAVLEADMKYQQVSMSPEDIQLLESRRFQIEDVARFFGVPSVLINDTESSTVWGSGIQQIVQGFYKLNLRPYLERLEASMVAHLAPPGQRARLTANFDFAALLRADAAERMGAHQKAVNAGVFTPNEARRAEGLEPVAGGDQLLVNGTMVPISMAGRRVERPTAPEAPDSED